MCEHKAYLRKVCPDSRCLEGSQNSESASMNVKKVVERG